jgi:nucleoside-diphosphate-sugar epimerase
VNGGRSLILGGTSLIGRFLLPRLSAEGARPLALSRAPRETPDVDWIAGDLASPKTLAGLPLIGAVFSLSPIWLLPDALPTLIDKGAGRIVAFSSTSRFTKTASPVAAERAVAARLAQSEDRVISICEGAGVAWTILRPTLIYAEGQDGNVSRLAGLIRRFGVLPLAGRGEGLRQPVHADDLAAAALAVLASDAARGRAYDLPGGETLTYREMAGRVFEGLGRRRRILSVPAPVWRLAFAVASPLLPGATAGMGARMDEDLTFDPAPAARDFGWSPRPFRPDFRNQSSSGPRSGTRGPSI